MNKISYEPEEMSLIMQSYLEASKLQFATMEEYLEWRSKLLPFLSAKATENRELLYNLAMITALLGSQGATKIMCKLVFRRILDEEFTERIREIEQLRKPRQA